YRARDSKLGREVAIKVLPDAFTRDPERLARLEREARLLASLNHPNIAAIYGLERSATISHGLWQLFFFWESWCSLSPISAPLPSRSLTPSNSLYYLGSLDSKERTRLLRA